jgi:hypothetical protein
LSNVEFDPQRWPGEGGSNAPRVVDAEPISESRANAQATLASAASASDDPYADDVTATTAATPSAAEALGGRGDADSVAVTDAAESNTEDAVLAPRAGRTAADESAQEKTAKRYEQSKSASDIEPVAGGGQDARDDAQTGQAAAIEKDASALERIETLESQLVADAEKARGNPAAAAKLAKVKAIIEAAIEKLVDSEDVAKISAQLDTEDVSSADANKIQKLVAMESKLDAAYEHLEQMKSTGQASAAKTTKLATAQTLIGEDLAKIHVAISGVAAELEEKASPVDLTPTPATAIDEHDAQADRRAAAIAKDVSALETIETLESKLVADAEKARGNPAAAAKLADAKANVQAAKKKISAQLEADVLAVDAADANNIGKAG